MKSIIDIYNLLTKKENRRYNWVFLTSLFVFGVVVALHMHNKYEYTLNIYKKQTQNINTIVKNDFDNYFKSVDREIIFLRDEIAALAEDKKNQKNYSDILIKKIKYFPEIFSFKIMNANADLVGDNFPILKPVNYADRVYFKYLKDNYKNDQFYVSEPVISKTANKYVIVMGRALIGPQGNFDGVLIATLELEKLKEKFHELNLEKSGKVVLLGDRDRVYFVHPYDEKLIGKQVNLNNKFLKFIDSKETRLTSEVVSPLDGIKKLYTVEKMNLSDMFVFVSFSKDEILRWWFKNIFIESSIILLSFILGFVVYVAFLKKQRELAERREMSLQSAKLASIGELTSGIAHEINNPLFAITGTTQRLLTDLNHEEGLDRTKLNDKLLKILNNAARIDKIIRGIKLFSRDSNREERSNVQLSKIIDESLDLLGAKIKHNEITIHYDRKQFEKVIIIVNEVQIVQVVVNLISNAIDAIKENDYKWVQIEAHKIDGIVKIKIIDSGMGIDEEIAKNMMDPFFTTKKHGEGTGMGLSISYGIIQGHRGKLYLDQSAQHTTFVVELKTSLDFDDVVMIHLKYKEKIIAYSASPDGTLKASVDAASQCMLGRWLLEDTKDFKNEYLGELIKIHNRFHQVSNEIITQANSQLIGVHIVEKINLKNLHDTSNELLRVIMLYREQNQ